MMEYIDYEGVQPDDPIAHGARWRRALASIANADPVDMALDPGWASRVAALALNPPPETPEQRHHRELHDGTLNAMPPARAEGS